MSEDQPNPTRTGLAAGGSPAAGSPMARMACLLCSAICIFTFENIWIDPRVARHFHHTLPSFAPAPMGGTWLLVLMALAIGLILAAGCLILHLRSARLLAWRTLLTGLLLVAAIAFSGKWVVATGGAEFLAWRQSFAPKHSVTLSWNASSTPGVHYNVFRGTSTGVHNEKLNAAPIAGLSVTDSDVISGNTYYYAIRAVDSCGTQSVESNEASVTIP